MTEYGIYLVCMCSLTALCSLISFGRDFSGSERTALGVILLSAAVLPIFSLVSAYDFKDFGIDGGYYEGEQILENSIEESFCEGIILALADKFDIPKEKIKVSVKGFSYEKMRAELVVVKLFGSAAASDIRSVRFFVEDNGFGDCEVVILNE